MLQVATEQLAAVKQFAASAEQQLQQEQDRCSRLQAQLRGDTGANMELVHVQQLQELTQRCDLATARAASALEELTEAQKLLHKAEQEAQQAKSEAAELTVAQAEAIRQLAQMGGQLAAARAAASGNDTHEHVERAHVALNASQQQLEAAREENRHHAGRVESMEAQIEDLTSQLQQALQESSEVRQHLSSRAEEQQQLEQRIVEFQQELNLATEQLVELDKLRSSCSKAVAELATTRQQLASLTSSSEAVQRELHELQSDRSSAAQQIQHAQDQLTAASDAKQELIDQRQQLQQQLCELRAEVQRLSSELQEARATGCNIRSLQAQVGTGWAHPYVELKPQLRPAGNTMLPVRPFRYSSGELLLSVGGTPAGRASRCAKAAGIHSGAFDGSHDSQEHSRRSAEPC